MVGCAGAVAGRAEPGALQIASAVASARRSLLPSGSDAARAAALLQAAALALEVDRTWVLRAGAAVPEAARADPGEGPERARARATPWLDPDLGALLAALGARWGHAAATPPDVPARDPWPGVPPRRRAAALTLAAPTLPPDAAYAVEALALDAALAERERAVVEAGLRDLLAAALLALAAAADGDPGHLEPALAILAVRAR